jgi:SSS family solute:Na+ symporter
VYIQAILSAKDAKAARNGAIIASICTFPVGLLAVGVGLYMSQFFPDIDPSQALPLFMIHNFNPIIAGIFIGGLMLAALGSNAGLIFGVSTMLSRDVYKKFRPKADGKEMLLILRGFIIVIAILAGIFAVTEAGSLIQTFVFLSFGMRTTVFLVPMLFAFYYKGRLTHAAGVSAVLAGPIVNIIWNLVINKMDASSGGVIATLQAIDPIYAGLAAALIAFVVANALALRGQPKIAPKQAEKIERIKEEEVYE